MLAWAAMSQDLSPWAEKTELEVAASTTFPERSYRLSSGCFGPCQLQFSSDQGRLAFTGAGALRVLELAGAGLERVADGPWVYAKAIAWSADGTRLFAAEDGLNADFRVRGFVVALSPDAVELDRRAIPWGVTGLACGPSSELAVTIEYTRRSGLWLLEPCSRDLRQISRIPARAPTFNPAGDLLLMHTTEGGVAVVDRTGEVQLSSSVGRFVAWQGDREIWLNLGAPQADRPTGIYRARLRGGGKVSLEHMFTVPGDAVQFGLTRDYLVALCSRSLRVEVFELGSGRRVGAVAIGAGGSRAQMVVGARAAVAVAPDGEALLTVIDLG